MTRLLIAALAAALIPTAAAAFDCSQAEDLSCFARAVPGTINMPPESTFTPCDQGNNWTHKLYTVTLANPAELTVTYSGMSAGTAPIYVYAGCDENDCVAVGDPFSNTLTTDCLPAGTYTVALSYLVDAIISYELSTDCVSCEPVAAEDRAWGGVKGLYD